MKATVIGSGIGGLTIAIRLANKGYKVVVYEKNLEPGGKMSEIHEHGYRFDTGPSLFTLPHLIEELFKECGKKLDDYMQYSLIENNCKYFFDDGTEFNFYHDKERLKTEVESHTTELFQTIEKRLKQSEEVYTFSAPVFLFSAFRKLSNFTTPAYKKMVFKLHKLNFFRTMHQANKHDFKDKRFVQLFDRYGTYNGSNPYKAPATLNMIAHLENNIGAFFPAKGMYNIVHALYRLALEKGVIFEFNTLVEQILVENKTAVGVLVNGQNKMYNLVVCNSDAKYTVNHLLKSPFKKRLNKATPSSSALIFYWGIKNMHSKLDVHNILFSAYYKKEFECIFKERTIFNDPTVYVFISSKLIKNDAPENCENWFVMINVPSNSGQNWEQLIKDARKNIIRKINSTLHLNIEEHIESERIASPLSIEKNTLSANGALYGTASNSMFSAFLRHPNSMRSIKNLHFVGGSVHPGGGIPLCIASSLIVNNEIPTAL